MKDRIRKALGWMAPGAAQGAAVAAVVVTGFVAYNMGARSTTNGQDHDGSPTTQTVPADAQDADVIYTCPMHPQIQQDEPGDCPICGMELVPMETDGPSSPDGSASDVRDHAHGHVHDHGTNSNDNGILGYACAMNCVPPLPEEGDCPICGMEMQAVHADDNGGPDEVASERRMSMSPSALALADIRTAPAERRTAVRQVRLSGQLAVAEPRRAQVSADVGGRIDRLYAEFEGQSIEEGQDLVLLYSPELLAVQREFLQAKRSLDNLSGDAGATIRRASEAAVAAGRERLRLAGLAPEQIDEIASEGTARERVTLRAPAAGTVLERNFEQGDYVPTGGRILTIADLSTVWAELEAYETDLTWLRVGVPVTFTAQAHPGETFRGEVAYIDPVMRPATRTTRIRVDVENPEGLLKPGMYVTGQADAELAEDPPPIVIPASAPLITGRRAIVYVKVPERERPTFEGREVVLGPRTRDGYVVREGLAEGEQVVVNGAFRIDSAMQIMARPSMMSPDGGDPVPGHDHGPDEDHDAHDEHPEELAPTHDHAETPALAAEALDVALDVYLELTEALASDDHTAARAQWERLHARADDAGDHSLHELAETGAAAEDIATSRKVYHTLSNAMIAAVQEYGNPAGTTIHLAHCPMAFDWEGADWLQPGTQIRNPYFGAEMLACGTIEAEFASND